MNIHEYQAKAIFARFGIPTLKGKVAFSVDEAVENANSLGGNLWAIKAQIHAGGRGRGGGIKIARNIEEVQKYSSEILGMNLITNQTGLDGKVVRKIYVESGADIQKEYYLALLLDRASEKVVIVASSEGGMDIEKVAKDSPEKISKIYIESDVGFKNFHGLDICKTFGLNKEESKKLIDFIGKLYKLYIEKDATLIEINPLIKTASGDFFALDAKMSFDDSSLYRNPDILELKDELEENPIELEASKFDLNYVKLDGDVACIVNGAGLAMATMDIINYIGCKPANFLDIGGGASEETILKAFEIIVKDKDVKVIFVNIFGGIVRCDKVASGILEAIKSMCIDIPIVVRLDGTNSSLAKENLISSNIKNIYIANDFANAADMVKTFLK